MFNWSKIALVIIFLLNSSSMLVLANEPNILPNQIIAEIQDYQITFQDIKKRFLMNVVPNPDYPQTSFKVSPKQVLDELIAEKAMLIEAEDKGLAKDAKLINWLDEFKAGEMIGLLLKNNVFQNGDDHNLNYNIFSSTRLFKNDKQKQKKINNYYKHLYIQKKVKIKKENFHLIKKIYQRLIRQVPDDGEPMVFIRLFQIQQQITEKEKRIVLAEFHHGTVTVSDWFRALTDFSPPSRPQNLDSSDQIENILTEALKKALFKSQAISENLDKDPGILKLVEMQKQGSFVGMMIQENIVDTQPTSAQVKRFFNDNHELFDTPQIYKVWRILFDTFSQANVFMKELDRQENQDFFLMKSNYPKEIIQCSINDQGIFFEQLINLGLGQIFGPMPVIYKSQSKWQMVRIIEKYPAKRLNLDQVSYNMAKFKMISFNREKQLCNYRSKLLKNYKYQTNSELFEQIKVNDLIGCDSQ